MGPFRRDRCASACAAIGWCAILSCLLVVRSVAQPNGSPPAPPAAGAGAGARAECSLHLLGGEGRIHHAGMSCIGPPPTIAIPSPHLAGYRKKFTGATVINSCSGTTTDASSCLLTICAGRLVLRSGSVSKVQGIALKGAVVCVVGDSRLEVHNSSFTENAARPFAVLDQAQLLLGASSIANNSVNGSGGGLLVAGGSHVNITGGSSIQGNNASEHGGGVLATGNATLSVDASSVRNNMALNGVGGGLAVVNGAHVTISNKSTVSNNTCSGGLGGGIAVGVVGRFGFDNRGRQIPADEYGSRVTISNSTVSNNTSIRSAGGGLAVTDGTVKLVSGTVVGDNRAINSSGGGVFLVGSGTLTADSSVQFEDNVVSQGYVGSSIAAFDNSTLDLPSFGRLTRCNVGVFLGQSTCQVGETYQNDRCQCCPSGTFSFTNTSCFICPPNTFCLGGSLVQPFPGFWASAPTSIQMHRCPVATTACNYSGPGLECIYGYTGPLCGVCQLPEYGMLSPFICGKCMKPKVQLVLYLLLSLVCVLFVAYTVHATWQDNVTGTQEVLATDMIKALVQFLQYIVIIGSVSVPWPMFNVRRWFQAVNIVFAAGSGQALSLDCWLVHYIPQGKLPLAMQRQLVYFIAPVFALLAVVVLQWLAWALRRWVVPLVCRPKRGVPLQPAMLVVRKLPVTLLVFTYYAYPTLLRASLGFFACMRIDEVPNEGVVFLLPGASAPLNHTHGYWVSDMEQPCFAGYHKGWALGLGLPSVLLWCIAVPVALGLGLFLCRAKADDDTFREHFGFLYRNYRPERIWWEAVWAARTVMLTLVSVFAYPMQRYMAVLSLYMVFWGSGALQNIFKPYAFPALHRLHMVSTTCLASTTVGVLAMFAYDNEQSASLQLRIAIALIVLLCNVVFVAYCLWRLAPWMKDWCVKGYNMVMSWVFWCTGSLRAGLGKGHGRRGGAGCCSM